MASENNKVRLIAFYLPQFHPIPENDQWWGKGFTEWRNVVAAKPLFRDHYQPHLPADLGFYDLRLAETRAAQAELARASGIHGFCYYHYWFNGRRLLERPFNEVLQSGKPQFPFCLCWANETWTRAWDGGDKAPLIDQSYSPEDDRFHIRSLIPAFKDRRYIRVEDKPLFLVYRAEDLPDPLLTTQIWREEARAAGIADLYLAKVESFVASSDPKALGFDSTVEFAPDWRNMGFVNVTSQANRLLSKLALAPRASVKHHISDYEYLMERMLEKSWPDYELLRCVTPGFDNSSRRAEGGVIFINSSPLKYERWLRQLIEKTRQHYDGDHQIVFVNAWNEWAEGNHLEPDQRNGRAYLEATKRALINANQDILHSSLNRSIQKFPRWKRNYWRARKFLQNLQTYHN